MEGEERMKSLILVLIAFICITPTALGQDAKQATASTVPQECLGTKDKVTDWRNWEFRDGMFRYLGPDRDGKVLNATRFDKEEIVTTSQTISLLNTDHFYLIRWAYNH